ncbi:type II secretion system F family protein [Pseudofulvimonas gallinarii]|uniref:Type IV pilus assembly protein PilC n=1 Tax=Pseudofulvimonas gallinarii TaxID=634155 RepID=A0A4R3LJP7_9GAMM|nr:type II secretion system F family protein [Pseudofulvimonas gallinarii]TCT00423.1 type IV pilus assembly protein PilC [Pseudofulvimonas gallinarii]THD12387.1 type II secretory pathway protein [Pseudofulvimonas gallinarii]
MAVATQRAQDLKLQTFIWQGKDKRGKVLKGEIEGKGEALVRADLRKQGLTGIVVRKKPKALFGGSGKPVKARDIAFFSRQIATMMSSGVPLVQSLHILSAGQKNPKFRKLVDNIQTEVEGGSALHEALAKHPVQFDELYVSLVKAGESAGVLDTVLATIADYKERMESIKGKIKKALMYPAIVIFISMLITAMLLIYVIPQFQDAFQSFGADLPGFTMMVINASEWMQSHGIWLLLGFIAAVAGIVFAKKRSRNFARTLDRLLLRIPIVGPIMHKAALARFARTLAITFRAGVPLVEALESVAGATGNIIYSDATKQIMSDVSVGHPLNLALRQSGLFPHMVVQMAAIGEEAGALDAMMVKVAEFYEEEVNNAVDTLSTALEPLIMVVIGGIVGTIVVAMYLPIFKLAATIG